MSDILIKGMDMPKACNKCRFHNAYICTAKNSPVNLNVYLDDKKPYDCPLAEILTPHRRMIDAEALESEIKRCFGHYNEVSLILDIIELIKQALTIIDEEE